MTASRLAWLRNLTAVSDTSRKGGDVDWQGGVAAKTGLVEPARGAADRMMGVSAEWAVRWWQERKSGTVTAAPKVEHDSQQEQNRHK